MPSPTDRGQETLFSHEPRDLAMLGSVAERTGQSAAAGDVVDYLSAAIHTWLLHFHPSAGHAPASAGWAPPCGQPSLRDPGSAHLTYLLELSD